jgi:hypothetical protein
MKKVIELLEQAKESMFLGSYYPAVELIKEALAELKAPSCRETPEQWKQRTGEPWPDNGAVYALTELGKIDMGWMAMSYQLAKKRFHYEDFDYGCVCAIICAIEAGPPPDDWRPEEETK